MTSRFMKDMIFHSHRYVKQPEANWVNTHLGVFSTYQNIFKKKKNIQNHHLLTGSHKVTIKIATSLTWSCVLVNSSFYLLISTRPCRCFRWVDVGAQGHVILSEILQNQLSTALAWPEKDQRMWDMSVSKNQWWDANGWMVDICLSTSWKIPMDDFGIHSWIGNLHLRGSVGGSWGV